MTTSGDEDRLTTDALIGPVSAPDVHVMTFNIRRAMDGPLHRRRDRWSWRSPAVRAVFTAERPTLVGLQEALPRVMPDVRASLGQGYRVIGTGRGKSGRGEGTPIVYDAAHLELQDWGQQALSDRPDSAGSIGWGNLIPRILVWAVFIERTGGTRFAVVNTHLDHLSPRARRRSALSVLQLVAGLRLPAIVMGDLNAGIGSASISPLEAPGSLVDSWSAAEGTCSPRWGTYPGYRRPRADGRVLDRILTTPDVRVRTAGVSTLAPGGRRPSDHLPVQAVVRFEKERA